MAEITEERSAIGLRRAQLRLDAGLTQIALSERSGVGQPTISSAENGGMLNESSARAIAAALEIEPGVYIDPPVVVSPAPSDPVASR